MLELNVTRSRRPACCKIKYFKRYFKCCNIPLNAGVPDFPSNS